MRSTAILAAIGALFTSGAAGAADVTARYVMPSIGNAIMTVQADDHGNSRISVGDESAMITTNGVTYIISADSEGRFVVRQEDWLAVAQDIVREMMGGTSPPPGAMETLPRQPAPAEAGSEIVAGRSGRRWIILPGNPPHAEVMDVVLSADPELAPIGRALAAQFAESAHATGAGVGPLGLSGQVPRTVRALLERGTILRYGQMARLQAVDTIPIPASAFALPSTPITREQFAARVRAQLLRRD